MPENLILKFDEVDDCSTTESQSSPQKIVELKAVVQLATSTLL
jgi:hypothetical protein